MNVRYTAASSVQTNFSSQPISDGQHHCLKIFKIERNYMNDGIRGLTAIADIQSFD
jgi:hypothetical protein